MGRQRVASLGRRQKPATRLTVVDGDAGAGGAEASGDELRLRIAEFGGAAIPDVGLAKIRLDLSAAAVELSQRKN